MRLRLRSLACFALIGAAASLAQAQVPSADAARTQVEQSMRAQATSGNIQAWLNSKDPRLIAWGAYFARENNDPNALDLAARLVKESLTQGGPDLFSSDAPHVNALAEVLDALIQRRVLLSAELLGYVARILPVQSLILVSMLPAAEQTGNLMQWFGGPRPAGYEHLDRVAAMLLSKHPPPGFAANILGSSEETLTIHIVPDTDGGNGLGYGPVTGGGCADGWVNGPPNEWPDLFGYHLTQGNDDIDPVLVVAGGDRISWQRSRPGGGFRTCVGAVDGLTPETRHHLLAEMLHERNEDMPWPTQKDVTIKQRSDEQVQREVGATILAEQAILLRSVQEFQARGLITPGEGATVLPKLSVVIRYEPPLKPVQ